MAKKSYLTNSEIAGFCDQLSLISKAGIPFGEGLSIMRQDAQDRATRAVLDALLASVEEGAALAVALETSGRFPKYMVDMVRVGEASGRLDEVLRSLSAYYARNRQMEQSIKSAVTYPAIMVGVMLVVVLVLVIRVLPVFQQVFQQLGSDLSPFALGLMHFGSALSANAAWLLGLLAALALLLAALRFSRGGRALLARMGARLFRRLHEAMVHGRFASGMALMVGSGMDIDTALDMTAQLVNDAATQARIAHAKELMAQGAGFADALTRTNLFSGLYAGMIAVGFRTGSVEDVMGHIAALYEEEIESRLARIISAIEPTIVAVLSVLVGMILLSVILPLMGVMSSI
nr:type II secretion system F family protein [Maliibacterium massiliense]